MSTEQQSRSTTIAYITGACCVVFLALTAIFTVGQLVVRGVVVLATEGRINPTYLALLFLVAIFCVAAKYVYSDWKSSVRYIAVADKHYVVEPANRRDEFLELDESLQAAG